MHTNPTAVVVNVTATMADEQRRVLERAGFTVFTAATFEEGCEFLKQVQPDLMVTEVRLLDYNGLHLADRARGDSPHTRSVIVGYPDLVLEEDARALGALYLTTSDSRALVDAARRLTDEPQPDKARSRDSIHGHSGVRASRGRMRG